MPISKKTKDKIEAATTYPEIKEAVVDALGVNKPTTVDIDAALEAHRPGLAENYKAIVRNILSYAINELGPKLDNVHKDQRFARSFDRHNNGIMSGLVVYDADGNASLNESRLEKRADDAAEATVQAWANKIKSKLGGIEDANVHQLDGYSFQITGTRNGKKIMIEQNMILKVSHLGTWFNQFPSRIYVDGKFTPEAQYKKEFDGIEKTADDMPLRKEERGLLYRLRDAQDAGRSVAFSKAKSIRFNLGGGLYQTVKTFKTLSDRALIEYDEAADTISITEKGIQKISRKK